MEFKIKSYRNFKILKKVRLPQNMNVALYKSLYICMYIYRGSIIIDNYQHFMPFKFIDKEESCKMKVQTR